MRLRQRLSTATPHPCVKRHVKSRFNLNPVHIRIYIHIYIHFHIHLSTIEVVQPHLPTTPVNKPHKRVWGVKHSAENDGKCEG